jgi:hypothetical protein
VHACAGIIGGLLVYITINGANWIIDKISEFGHWTMTGTDTDVPVIVDRSFIGRVASNTGTAGLVRAIILFSCPLINHYA